MKEIAIQFGKLNPPHAGHHALVQSLIQYANNLGIDHRVYTSKKYLKKLKSPRPHEETPLSPEQKAKHLKRVLGTENIHFEESPHAAIEKLLNQGYTKVHIMVGSDRYENLAPNLKELYGDKVHVQKFGENRDSNSKGLAGFSSSALRKFAKANNFEDFLKMMPTHLPEDHARELFDDVRGGLKAAKVDLIENKNYKHSRKEPLFPTLQHALDHWGLVDIGNGKYQHFTGIGHVFNENELNFMQHYGVMQDPNTTDNYEQINRIHEEVSVQTRIKLSRIAKRNAKIRAAKRRARRKRRRNIPQLKKRAKQEVKSQLRHKFAKRPWKKLGFASRVNIDKNVNRRKKIADTMVRRILPSVIRGENQRLQSVNRHESIENILLPLLTEAVRGSRKLGSTKKGVNSAQERVGARNRKRKQRSKTESKKKSGIVKGNFAVVKSTKGKHAGRIMIVSRDSINPNSMKELVSSDKFNLAAGKKATTDKSFINTDSSIELFGMIKGEGKAAVKKGKKTAEAKPKAKRKAKEDGPTPEQRKAQKELMDKQQKPMIPATKKATTKDTFATSHDSTSMEAGIAYQVNAAMGLSPEQMVKQGLIDEPLLKSIMENNHESFAPSCLRAAQLIMKQYPGCIIRHTGRSKKEVKLTDLAKDNGMVDTTPKPDFLVEEQKTGKVVAAMSQKIGKDTQLGSGSPAELKTNLLWASGQSGNTLTPKQQKTLEKIIDIFDKQLKGNPRTKRGPVTLWQQGGELEGKDKEIKRREKLHRDVTNLFNDLMNENEELRSNFVYASLTGAAKFEPGIGIATHIFSANRDGTDAKITPITEKYASKISGDGKIKFQATFKSSAVETSDIKKKWAEFKKEKQRLGQKIKMNEDWRAYALRSVLRTFLSESFRKLSGSHLVRVLLEKLEDSVPKEPQTEEEAIQYLKDAIAYIGNDALKMYQFFEDSFDIDAVSSPIDYTEYAENTNKLTNSVFINGKEHKISVEVPYDYSEQGNVQNEINESKRNYRKEYDNYHSRPEQRKNRAGRVKARRLMIKMGRARKGDGKDIDHRDGNPRNNGKKNLRVRSKSENRADND